MTKELPKDAEYIGSAFGWRNRSVYWSPAERKYFVAMTFPIVEKGYDVYSVLPSKVIPRGFHIGQVEAEVAKKMALEKKLKKMGI